MATPRVNFTTQLQQFRIISWADFQRVFAPQISGTVSGHLCVDTLYKATVGQDFPKIPGLPKEGLILGSQLWSLSSLKLRDMIPTALRKDVKMSKGGPGGSAAQAIVQFDEGTCVRPVFYIGHDKLGDFLKEHFKQHGLAWRQLRLSKEKNQTSETAARERAGQNAFRDFIHEIGANYELTAKSFRRGDFLRKAFFHIGGNFLCPNLDLLKVFRMAKRVNPRIQTSLDTVFDFTGGWCLPEGLQEVLDVLTMDLLEAGSIAGIKVDKKKFSEDTAARILNHFMEMGFRTVVIKLGKQGSIGCEAGLGAIRMPVCDVVDYAQPDLRFTTGSGDVFSGVLVDCLARGLDLDISMGLATAAANFKLKHRGGELGIPGNYFRGIVEYYNALAAQTSTRHLNLPRIETP
jgi:sugar/nucleoside kinase (ribokinase family)